MTAPLLAILGGGQLGQMLAHAATDLGVRTRALDPSPGACARSATELIVGSFDDPPAIARLTDGASCVTFEFENVPPEALQAAGTTGVPMRPSPASLRIARDRLLEKQTFARAGLDVQAHRPVDSIEDLRRAIDEVRTPCVLKQRTGGYDGKGQAVIQDPSEAEAAWDAIAHAPAICESFVSFARELSLVGVRSIDGETRFFPLVENTHRNGILVRTIAPAPNVSPDLQASIESRVRTLMEQLDHVGVLALELFDAGEQLIANEMAPRVHNTGHWSMDGCSHSQFDLHVRACLGMELPSSLDVTPTIMLNMIGSAVEHDAPKSSPGLRAHVYGKSAKPGRKLGHINITGDDPRVLLERADRVSAVLHDAGCEHMEPFDA